MILADDFSDDVTANVFFDDVRSKRTAKARETRQR